MRKKVYFYRALRIMKSVLLTVFLVFWTIGLFMGGMYGIASVICGVPFAIGFAVFE